MTGSAGPAPNLPEAAAIAAAAEAFEPLSDAAPRPALIQEMWWGWVKAWPVQLPHERLYLFLRLDASDPVEVEAAVRALIARHDTLRSRFREEDGRLIVSLNSPDDFQVQTHVADLGAGADIDAALTAERGRFAAEPLRIDADWLVRAGILIAPSALLLCLVFHHMVFDARSRVLVEHELRARLGGGSVETRPQQYLDYAAWEQDWLERSGHALVDYWRHWLADAPPLRNPAGGTLEWRPGHKVYWEFELNGEPVAALKTMIQASTPFRPLLVATAIAASHWAGQSKIVLRVVGDVRTSRPLGDMVGNLVCTDLVALEVGDAPDVAALLEAAWVQNRAAVRLRCPNLLGLPGSPAYPDVSPGSIGTKTAVTLNYMPLYKLRGQEPPAPGALGASAPAVPTRSLQREYWPTPVCPINLRIWDWGERLVCRMEFDDDVISQSEQRRLIELFRQAVHDLPKGLAA